MHKITLLVKDKCGTISTTAAIYNAAYLPYTKLYQQMAVLSWQNGKIIYKSTVTHLIGWKESLVIKNVMLTGSIKKRRDRSYFLDKLDVRHVP